MGIWKDLTSSEQLDTIIEDSYERPAVIYKHSTGQPASWNGVSPASAPGVETAKPVALSTTAGGAAARVSATTAAPEAPVEPVPLGPEAHEENL